MTRIWTLTALTGLIITLEYSLENEKLTQTILDTLLHSALTPWKTFLDFMLKLGMNLRYTILTTKQQMM